MESLRLHPRGPRNKLAPKTHLPVTVGKTGVETGALARLRPTKITRGQPPTPVRSSKARQRVSLGARLQQRKERHTRLLFPVALTVPFANLAEISSPAFS